VTDFKKMFLVPRTRQMQQQWERGSAVKEAETMQRCWGPECYCFLWGVTRDGICLTNHSQLLKLNQVRVLGV